MGVSSKSDFIHLLTVLTHKEDKISREDTICLNKVYYLENDLPQGSKFFLLLIEYGCSKNFPRQVTKK